MKTTTTSMSDLIIAMPPFSPPVLIPRPASFRGLVWSYLEPTPENARRAIERHNQHFADWGKDDQLVKLAAY